VCYPLHRSAPQAVISGILFIAGSSRDYPHSKYRFIGPLPFVLVGFLVVSKVSNGSWLHTTEINVTYYAVILLSEVVSRKLRPAGN